MVGHINDIDLKVKYTGIEPSEFPLEASIVNTFEFDDSIYLCS